MDTCLSLIQDTFEEAFTTDNSGDESRICPPAVKGNLCGTIGQILQVDAEGRSRGGSLARGAQCQAVSLGAPPRSPLPPCAYERR